MSRMVRDRIADTRPFRFSDEREELLKEQVNDALNLVYVFAHKSVSDLVTGPASMDLMVWAMMFEMIGEKLLNAADKMMILSERARRAEFKEQTRNKE